MCGSSNCVHSTTKLGQLEMGPFFSISRFMFIKECMHFSFVPLFFGIAWQGIECVNRNGKEERSGEREQHENEPILAIRRLQQHNSKEIPSQSNVLPTQHSIRMFQCFEVCATFVKCSILYALARCSNIPSSSLRLLTSSRAISLVIFIFCIFLSSASSSWSCKHRKRNREKEEKKVSHQRRVRRDSSSRHYCLLFSNPKWLKLTLERERRSQLWNESIPSQSKWNSAN